MNEADFRYLNGRIEAIAEKCGGSAVFGLMGYYGPDGRMWIAPLGAPPPAAPMPIGWLPVTMGELS